MADAALDVTQLVDWQKRADLTQCGTAHPDCAKMHCAGGSGYCVCTMVACARCSKNHPPHKACAPLLTK